MRQGQPLLPNTHDSQNLPTTIAQESYVEVGGAVASVAGTVIALCVFYLVYRMFTHRSADSSHIVQTDTGANPAERPSGSIHQGNMHQRLPHGGSPTAMPATFSPYPYSHFSTVHHGQHALPTSPPPAGMPAASMHQHSLPYSPHARRYAPVAQPAVGYGGYQAYQYDASGPFGTGRGRPGSNRHTGTNGDSNGDSITEQEVDDRIASVMITFPPTSSHDAQVCPICLDPLHSYPPLASLPCLHTAHAECLNMWLRKDYSLSCPVCRVPGRQ